MLNYLWSFIDSYRHRIRRIHRPDADITNAALDSSQRSHLTLYYHDRCHVFLGRTNGNCFQSRNYPGRFQKDPAGHSFPFPNLPAGHPAEEPITTNIIANILGLGWAATPAGLKAMEELSKLEEQRRKHLAPGISRPAGTASNEMCTFLIINISSLQLIPINVIAYRSQYGSVNPASIIGAGIVSTLISTAIAVIYCKLKERSRFQN